MIWHIALKEFKEATRDGRFLWSSLIIVALLLVAMGIGAERYAADRSLREAAASADRELWLNQGDKGPHSAGHYGVYAFKPATPLALFDPGYNDYTGVIQYLEAHKENQASYKPAADATALQRFGDLSGAMVLQLLVPLLIILLCFGLVSGERENGTLRQLISMGVGRSTIVWGKGLGVVLALGIVLVPAVLVGGIVASFMEGSADPHDMVGFPLKLLLIALFYLVFFGIFIALSLTVSIVAKSSGAALTMLIGFWIITGLLVPRSAADVSKMVYDTPSSFEVAAAVEEGRAKGPRAHEPNHPNHIAFKEKVLKEYNVEKVEDLPVNFIGLALQADEELGFKVFDQTYGEVRRLFEKQNRIHQAFSVLSPFVAIKNLSAAISGTDVAFANDFSEAAEQYRRNMVRILNEDIQKNTVGMTNYSTEWGYRANKSLWEKIPPFDFEPPSVGTILSRNVLSIVILFAWFVGGLWLLNYAAKRAKIDI